MDFRSFDTPEDTRTVDQIVTAFDSFAIGEVNEPYERYIFNKRHQDESESFELFLSALRKLIKTCNYCRTCVNSILRDRIVLGIRDTNTQQALLKERKLTLDICPAAENATAHIYLQSDNTRHRVTRRWCAGWRRYAVNH